MCKETIARLKKAIKLAKLDKLPAAHIARLEQILAEESALFLRSRLPGSHQTVADDMAEQAEGECEDDTGKPLMEVL
jgi:hypothetical protein